MAAPPPPRDPSPEFSSQSSKTARGTKKRGEQASSLEVQDWQEISQQKFAQQCQDPSPTRPQQAPTEPVRVQLLITPPLDEDTRQSASLDLGDEVAFRIRERQVQAEILDRAAKLCGLTHAMDEAPTLVVGMEYRFNTSARASINLALRGVSQKSRLPN